MHLAANEAHPKGASRFDSCTLRQIFGGSMRVELLLVLDLVLACWVVFKVELWLR